MSDPIKAFEHHLKNHPVGVSAYTIRDYVGGVRKFADWYYQSNGEKMLPENVTPVDIRNYKEHLQVAKRYKPATINRHLSSLRTYFGWVIEEGMIEDDPIRVRNVEEPQTAPRSLDEKTYLQLLRAAQRHGNKRDEAILQVLRHTGLRVGELCSLTLDDIEISPRKGKVTVQSGKGGKYREVPLNLDARKALQAYFDERPHVDDDHVFIGQRGNGLTPSAVQALVKKYAHHARLDEVTPHVLRHTFGRSLIDRGVDLVTVKELMGHKRVDSTARYTKPSQRDLEGAVARLAIEEG
jgi:site-specific recombinase XerD